jgi:hypothetical protein
VPGALPGGGAGGRSGGAADPCALGINFFPVGGDNRPTGWTQAVQANAGNTASDQLIKIALAGYPLPMLYMAPVSPFTQVNGQIPGQCIGGPNGILTRPAAFTITYAIAGMTGTLGPFTKGSKQDPPANITLPMAPRLPDVSCCSCSSRQQQPLGTQPPRRGGDAGNAATGLASCGNEAAGDTPTLDVHPPSLLLLLLPLSAPCLPPVCPLSAPRLPRCS